MSSLEVSKDSSKRNILILGIASLLFIYVFVRAYLMSFTRDESYSFLEYVVPNYWILPSYNDVAANDHLLNTWLMIIFNSLFGSSEISLRLPNVLASIMFFYFCYKFTKEIENNILAVSAFILLTFNPYLLDFFSVARGYGLTLAFTMGNLYFFYKWINDRGQFKFALRSLLFAYFAVLSNFTLINVFLLILGLELVLVLFSKEPGKLKKLVLILLFPLSLFTLIIPILIRLKEAGSFNLQNFGEAKGLWGDTFETLIYKIFYQRISFAYAEEIFAVLGLLLFVFAVVIVIKNKDDSNELTYLRFLLFALTFLIGFIYALHFITGAQFPRDRTGLFFLPFISLLLVFVLRWWNTKSKWSIILSSSIALFALIHFGRSANLLYAIEYKDDAYIKTASQFIKQESGNKPISIGVHYSFYKPFNYYAYLWKQDKWKTCYRDSLWTGHHDYYFVYPNDIAEMKMDSVVSISVYERTNTFLYKNKRKYKVEDPIFFALDDADKDPITKNISMNYSNGNTKSYKTDSTIAFSPAVSFTLTDTIKKINNIVLRFETKLYSDFKDADVHLVISVQRGDSVFLWQDHDLSFNILTGAWEDFSFNVVLPKTSRPGDIVKGYVWNRGIREVDIDEMILEGLPYPF